MPRSRADRDTRYDITPLIPTSARTSAVAGKQREQQRRELLDRHRSLDNRVDRLHVIDRQLRIDRSNGLERRPGSARPDRFDSSRRRRAIGPVPCDCGT
jgi:hypothetical protein